MDWVERRAAAARALRDHERRYDVVVPDRLRAFYEGGFDAHHLRWVRGRVPAVGADWFQVALTPPTWRGKDDDAINGPDGEWAAAGWFVPVFVTDQSLYVVVDLRSAGCATGWYEEGRFDWARDGHVDGVLGTHPSLDVFLAALCAQAGAGERCSPDDPGQSRAWKRWRQRPARLT